MLRTMQDAIDRVVSVLGSKKSLQEWVIILKTCKYVTLHDKRDLGVFHLEWVKPIILLSRWPEHTMQES